jgi:hypothetical protein
MADIKERPILFQTEMVKAILEGRKTQTRRTKGLDEINRDPNHWSRIGDPRKNTVRFWDSRKESNPNPLAIHYGFREPYGLLHYVKSPYGKPGDLLWVRESWTEAGRFESDFYANSEVNAYRTKDAYFFPNWKQLDTSHWNWDKLKWKPSIHMPKDSARIWLIIEDIRVERVQEINEKDAKDEGVKYIESNNFFERGYKNYLTRDLDDPNYCRAVNSFKTLWISINGQNSFDSNPWVWVIQFRVLSTTGKPNEELIHANYKEVNNG